MVKLHFINKFFMGSIGYWIDNRFILERDCKEKNLTIFQRSFATKIGTIPVFCYHENLSIAGNCRLCLVELTTSVKLVASCAMPVTDGMRIFTKTDRVKNARESIIEFFLLNHPLDCAVCDQAGECDLQDVNDNFGSDKSRYYEYSKRAVLDKEAGVFIKMIMNRCIHCTRCIRFFNEISGNEILGMINRGYFSEISTYIFVNLHDELSGNVIDLCPVGALTSIPYAFKARPWELGFVESIDIMDTLSSDIRIETLNNKVVRILPIYNSALNEDWITNRTRFFYISNELKRISSYQVKDFRSKFVTIEWNIFVGIFYYYLNMYIRYFNILVFVDMFIDLSSMQHLKIFFNSIGVDVSYSDYINVNNDFRENFLFNELLINLENYYFFIFFGLNIRLESPILNTRLRKLYLLNNTLKFFSFGITSSYLNLPIKAYGNSLSYLINIIKSKNIFNFDMLFFNYSYLSFNFFLKKNKFMFFFGISFYQFFFSKFLIDYLYLWIKNNFLSFYSVVLPFLGNLSFFEFNSNWNYFFLNKFNFIFFNTVDNSNFIELLKKNFKNLKKNFFIYKGFFHDKGVKISNIIIPSFTFFEEDFVYLNFEGRYRKSFKAVSADLTEVYNDKMFFFTLKNCINFYKYTGSIFINFSIIFDFFKKIFNINMDWILSYKNKKKLKLNKNFNFFLKNFYFEDFLFTIFFSDYYSVDVYSRRVRALRIASYDYSLKLNVFI